MIQKCQEHKEFYFTVLLVATNRPDLSTFPKYIPQLHKRCSVCNTFIGLEKQTPELIQQINTELKNSKLFIPQPLL